MFDRLAGIVAAVMEALDVPLKVALVSLNMLVLLFWLFAIGLYGYYPILGLIVSEMPIVYLVAKEVRRQVHIPPKKEGFDLNSEQMDRALEEYVEMIQEKRNRGKR